MPDPNPNPPGDPEKPPIADAAELFRDQGAAPPERPASGPGAPSEGYALEETEEPPAAAEPPPAPIPAPAPAPRRPRPAPVSAPSRPSTATVEEPWSRMAEWGPNLVVLAIVGVAVLFLVYETSGEPALAFFLFLLGGAALLALSYPIMITLERPVRITPEQAVKDFYASLSHHVPHYRRMWLLLSSAGRFSSHYASYEGFKNYWRGRLAQLRGDQANSYTPLVFKVDNFKSEPSAGLTSIDVRFTVTVHIRGRQNEEPVAIIPVEAGLIKGPDKMWYLNKGTLPDIRGKRNEDEE